MRTVEIHGETVRVPTSDQRQPELAALPTKMVIYLLTAVQATINQIEYEVSQLDEGYETIREDYLLSDLRERRNLYFREVEYRGWTRTHAMRFINNHTLMIISWGRSPTI